ncbi:MAG: MMPL family transporter, partial [Solirubrobacterales bacterium]
MRDLLARIAGWAVERPAPVLAATVLVTLVGAIAALRLEADAGTSQLVDRDSETFAATEEFKREFGDDAVVVLVKGDLEQLMLTEDIGTLLALEGCLSGNAPEESSATQAAPEPCAELAESKPARVVYGPGTFLNQFAIQAQRLLSAQSEATVAQARKAYVAAARDARRAGASQVEQRRVGQAAAQEVLGAFQQEILDLAVRYGQTGLPSLDDPTFVSSVVFDSRSPGQPKARFSYLFPSADAALISVRLRPELSESERGEAIDLIRAAVADPAFEIRKSEYVVSGVPVVVDGLAEKLSGEIFVLLAVALAVMALTLTLVFGPPIRLLPLLVALGAASVTFGVLAAVGGSLTMASLAVMPILIGLAVDYAIQFQARFAESRRAGSSPARAAVEAAARGGPAIATAALATGAGFLVLLLSPIPMIRGFGLLLVLGITVAFALALTVGLATLSLTQAAARRPSAAAGSALARRGEGALQRAGEARERAAARIAAA